MLLNGKNYSFDQKESDNIQTKINQTTGFPDDLQIKTEIEPKELKAINSKFDEKNDTIGGFDFTGFNSFANGFQQNNNTFIEAGDQYQNRINYYNIFNEMSHTNFINRALQAVCDDACQKNNDGNVINITSEDEDTKNILEDLWHKRLNINKELWSIIYETIKLGDNYYEIIPDSYDTPKEIARIRYLEPSKVNRIEKNGKLIFYTYTDDKAKESNLQFDTVTDYDKQKDKKEEIVQYRLQPWQIVHFKITDKDFHPYGGSLLKSGVRTFRRLTMLEDAILVYRLARVPERRVFKIGVGNMSPNEANRYTMKVRDNYRTSQVLDDNGTINRKAAALSITQDVFIPIRDGETGTDVSTLPGGQGLNTIDDLKYFRDQILMTLNIPPSYLGMDDQGAGGAARGSLAMQDIKFARFIERIQYSIEEGLTKISYIELFFKKKKKEDLSNFKLELTAPSNMKEVIDIEFVNQKMSLIQSMSSTNLFPAKYILKNVMHFSTKEINDIMLFKQLEAGNAQGGAGGMLGGDMGMGGGMPMDMGGGIGGEAPMPTPPPEGGMPPPETGGEPPLVQDKIINLFGKDILIEKKEDFFKLIKAMDEWKKTQKEEMTEEEENEFIELVEKCFNKKQETRNTFLPLLNENELGGLSFKDQTFAFFSKPKKRTGRKSTLVPDVMYEEIKLNI